MSVFFLFTADQIVEKTDQHSLRLSALIAGSKMIQEGRDVPTPFPAPDTQPDKVSPARKIEHDTLPFLGYFSISRCNLSCGQDISAVNEQNPPFSPLPFHILLVAPPMLLRFPGSPTLSFDP